MNSQLALAELLGLLCAEGSHIIAYSSYWDKSGDKLRYVKNKRSERIEFYNKDSKLLNRLKDLLFAAFDYHASITKDNKINIGKRKTIGEIITHTELGHLKWKVPFFVKCGSDNIKIAFIRGFFDGDGTCINRIRFFSTNINGLKDVSVLLQHLNFKHTIQKPIIKQNRKPCYTLQVSERKKETFLNTIKPISKRPVLRG